MRRKNMTTHEEQQKIWDAEHANPNVLKQMDADTPSGGVVKFSQFLKEHNIVSGRGIEMGCGKGRNVIWLSQKGFEMHGFDFAPSAIAEAKRRATSAKSTAALYVHDATIAWPYETDSFDFGIDCFASTDIVEPVGRAFAISEMYRILRPGGHLLAYLLSTDDEFHNEMVQKSPAKEKNAFLHPTGKFEKTFDESEIRSLYEKFELVRLERIAKTTTFNNREYACNHFWVVFRKPLH